MPQTKRIAVKAKLFNPSSADQASSSEAAESEPESVHGLVVLEHTAFPNQVDQLQALFPSLRLTPLFHNDRYASKVRLVFAFCSIKPTIFF